MGEAAVLNYDAVLRDDEAFNAILFSFGSRAVWIPRSQVLDVDEAACTVTVPEWLALNEGLV